jgi:uncharacterized protein YeaO (DUF488 family)
MNWGATAGLILRKCYSGILVILLLCLSSWAISAEVYYRYVDDRGVRVLNDSIPPEYVQKGYEVVNISGDVLKVVPPTPDAETLARKEAEAKLREEFERLNRRYSSLADIHAAKERKLETIDTNITIVRGNISGLEAQIESLMAQAADVERAGREVPQPLLQKLGDTRAELATTKELLAARLKEYKEVAAQFDADMATFVRGKELAKAK